MKIVLLLALLLLASSTFAQTSGAAAPALPLDSAALPTASDTLAALHQLFAAKQKKLIFILLGTAAAELAGQVVVGTSVKGGGLIDEQAIDQVFMVLLAVPVVTAEVFFYSRYNRKHEQRAVEAFNAHHLPQYLKRQLKAKFFR